MKLHTLVIVVLTSFALAPLAHADLGTGTVSSATNTEPGTLESSPPPGTTVFAECSVSAGEVCTTSFEPGVSAWNIAMSACSNDADPTTCSTFTGTVRVLATDGTSNQTTKGNYVAGESGTIIFSDTFAKPQGSPSVSIVVDTLPLEVSSTGQSTPVAATGGPVHVWFYEFLAGCLVPSPPPVPPTIC